MPSTLSFREPREGDTVVLAQLLGELGYPTDPAEVSRRLIRLVEFGCATILVADIVGIPAGVVTVHVFPSIHASAPVAWLTTLVVRREDRGRGIGSRLVLAGEEWAVGQGAVRLSVSSDAHRFYERLGYGRTGLRLTKALASAG